MFLDFLRYFLGEPPDFNSVNYAAQIEYIGAVVLLIVSVVVIFKLLFAFIRALTT